MASGSVKWFSVKKGFGFIKPDDVPEDGPDVFVHFSAINAEEGSFKTLHQNDKVTFDVVQSDKGQEAKNVNITEKAPRPPPRKFNKKKRDNSPEEDEE